MRRNLYEPHPFMIDSGTFWRCDHGSTGWYACTECGKAHPEEFKKHFAEVGRLLSGQTPPTMPRDPSEAAVEAAQLAALKASDDLWRGPPKDGEGYLKLRRDVMREALRAAYAVDAITGEEASQR